MHLLAVLGQRQTFAQSTRRVSGSSTPPRTRPLCTSSCRSLPGHLKCTVRARMHLHFRAIVGCTCTLPPRGHQWHGDTRDATAQQSCSSHVQARLSLCRVLPQRGRCQRLPVLLPRGGHGTPCLLNMRGAKEKEHNCVRMN